MEKDKIRLQRELGLVGDVLGESSIFQGETRLYRGRLTKLRASDDLLILVDDPQGAGQEEARNYKECFYLLIETQFRPGKKDLGAKIVIQDKRSLPECIKDSGMVIYLDQRVHNYVEKFQNEQTRDDD